MQKTFATKLSEKQQIYTPNLMLNAVINEKKEICEKNHIRFVIHVKLPENIDTIELAIALSNLLDNAIEAEQKEQEQEIHLNMEVVDEMFNLIVENHIQNSVLCVNPKLVTSKKIRLNMDWESRQFGRLSISIRDFKYIGRSK